MDDDKSYLDLLLRAIRVSAKYRPMFGQGRQTGLNVEQFRQLYGSDPFYAWMGLDSPLVYAAHRAAGGITSVYRQLGIGCQWLISQILQDKLSLSKEAAAWSYLIPGITPRKLSLDARIPLSEVNNVQQTNVNTWLQDAAQTVGLESDTTNALKGAVFEVRQGYKSKDAKRQNADVANAVSAYAALYLPVVILLSNQIDTSVAERYRRARWLILRGSTDGTSVSSTYVFFRDIIGYDLAAFFTRQSATLRHEIEAILEILLSDD